MRSTWNNAPRVCRAHLVDPGKEGWPVAAVGDVEGETDPVEHVWIVDVGVDTGHADTSAATAEWGDT